MASRVGGGTPIFEIDRELLHDWHMCWPLSFTFSDPIRPLFYAQIYIINLSFCKKKEKTDLSLSHIVSKITTPKNVASKSVIWQLWSNLYQFLPWFFIPFSLFLAHFDSSFYQNLRTNWLYFFIVCWNPKIFKFWWNTSHMKRDLVPV